MVVTSFQVSIFVLLTTLLLSTAGVPMECKYGPRGSLTVFCTNATADYFKASRYRYDHLDETLKCTNCTLTTIEMGTFDLSLNQIKTVDIRNSKIQVIKPKAFIGLIFMERLLLSYNPITDIYPGAFIGIRKVKYLDMESAVSQLVPLMFQELNTLEVLILRSNNLVMLLPDTFLGLINLKVLDLSNNRLEHLSISLDPLENLLTLDLTNNNLKVIKGYEFTHLKNVLAIKLEHNYIQHFAINMDLQNNLRVLNLASNLLNAKLIYTGTFRNLSNLEELNFSYNVFTTIPPKFFQGLYRLRIINFFNNKLKIFSTGSYSGLPHLSTLNLSHNHLEAAKVTGRLILPSLHSLDLSDNDIKSFDYFSMIARLPKLSDINLLNNNLPCIITSAMEVLFEEDGIDFAVSTSSSSFRECINKTETFENALQEASDEFRQEHEDNTALVWMCLSITIIFVLLGVAFYIQFFVLGVDTLANVSWES